MGKRRGEAEKEREGDGGGRTRQRGRAVIGSVTVNEGRQKGESEEKKEGEQQVYLSPSLISHTSSLRLISSPTRCSPTATENCTTGTTGYMSDLPSDFSNLKGQKR